MTARQPPLVDVCWAVTSFSATLPAVDDTAASYAMDEQQESWIRRAVPLTRLATAATRQQFQSAPLVLGYDESAERLVLVYGSDALADPARTDEIERHGLVFRFDGRRSELDDLLSACRELKCQCDYDERADTPQMPPAGGQRRVDTGESVPTPSSPRRGRRARRGDES